MRRLRSDERGVSVLVSAVLVLGLLVIVAGTYTAKIIPQRVEETEAQHLMVVDESFGRISNALSSDIANPVRFNTELTLGTELNSMFVTRGSTAHLFVHQDAFKQTIECTGARLLTLGQSPAPGAGFATIPTTKTDLAFLEFARIKLDDYAFRNGPGSRIDRITLEAVKDDKLVGRLTVELDGGERHIRVLVTDAVGILSTDMVLDSGMAGTVPSYLIDVLNPIYGFSGMVAGIDDPWTLRFTPVNARTGLFALYRTPDGSPGRIGEGATVTGRWSETMTSDALVFEADPTQFVGQTYALEGAAFSLAQPEGQVLRAGSIAAVNGASRWISLSGMEIDGHGSRSGSGVVQVEFNREPVGRKIAICENPKWTAQTSYPDAWVDAWRRVQSSSGANIEIKHIAGGASAQVWGPGWFIEWTEGRIQVDFRP
jgi:hypothetical protein